VDCRFVAVGATEVRYDAGDWGVGALWLDAGGRVLAHDHPRWDLSISDMSFSAETAEAPYGGTKVPCRDGSGETVTNGIRESHENVTFLPQRLAAFFAGEAVDFGDVELDLDWCTPFGRELAAALRGVGRGEVVTYGELAALAGRPNAHRAAGSFCARNRHAIFLPCHRVVAAGGIGGYGSLGLGYKRRLLALEGVEL
jgi:methylated-DNA-[protein]-cysteine S-methyltransferase